MGCKLKENEYEKVIRVLGELELRPSLMDVSVGTYLDKCGLSYSIGKVGRN